MYAVIFEVEIKNDCQQEYLRQGAMAMFRKKVEWSRLSLAVVYLEVCYAASAVSSNS